MKKGELKMRRFVPSRQRLLLSSAVFVGATIVGGAAVAQSASPPSGAASTTPSSDGVVLGDVIVTAQRRSERAQSAPLAITAVTGKELLSTGVNSIAGLSQNIPNVEFGGNAADAKIFIRGVGYDSISPGGETRVAVYENNVYEARSQAAFTTLYDIDRVEVLRGPQGTLYGRNAVAGAINIITADPGAQLNGYVSGTGGNYGLIQTEGAVGGPLTQWLGARVAFQTVDRGGYGRNIGTGEPVNDDHSRSVRATLVATPVDNVQDRLVADYYDEKDHNFGYRYLGYSYPEDIPAPVALGALVPTNIQDSAGQGPNNHLQTYGLSNELRVDINKFLTLTSVTGYRHLTSQLADSVYGGLPDLGIQLIYENSNSVTQEVRLSGAASVFKYVIGGYYFYEDHVADNRAPFNALLFGGPNEFVQFYNAGGTERTNAFAGFGQTDIKIFPALTLTLGIRYSSETKNLIEFESVDLSTPYDTSVPETPYFPTTGLDSKSASWSSLDPRISLSYQFNPRIIAYVTYSQGFKSGGFNIGGLQPAFAPERITDYEGGVKGDYLDGRLRANIDAFYYDYTNLQVNETQGLSEQTINAASATVKGVEAEITAIPTTHLRVSLNLAWLDATYTHFTTEDPARLSLGALNLAGNYLNYSPKYKAALDVAYTIPSPYGDFIPTADVTWTDRIYFTPFNTPLLSQPAHANLDLYLRWVGVDPVWSGNLFIRNVTNAIYIAGAGVNNPLTGYDREGQVSAPRTFGIALTRHF